MRQTIVLEREEIELLKRGEPLILNIVGGKPIEIMFDQTRRYGNRHTGPSQKAMVLEAISGSAAPMKPRQIAEATQLNVQKVYDLAYRLGRAGKIIKTDAGWSLASTNGNGHKKMAVKNGK